ncbi:hypothetical protein [Alloactinosynnema sp. L-07]|uniref:hypothetical protein n=1 Tax=Alloactinosynnema sp. L-07 TaxID=1653480 RepID=UPI00065F058C|nr:hypothetical protein [Alloactinosynnema sp. L-07]CRK57594.1 hypothetical protein [Alloactinosynnema sp. L-07]
MPFYPFNEPGHDITSYEGALIEVDDRELRGSIRMRCHPSHLDVRWQIDEDVPERWALGVFEEPEIDLQVRESGTIYAMRGLRHDFGSGSLAT